MYFVGVDLAWGPRGPTGIAVADETGSLCEVAAAGSDEQILAALRPYVGEDCVVALDAPLVVTNSGGNRPCEAALNADFRRFHAGAHPANTGLAWFADGGRGARLCAELALDLDPASTARRRGMEVYPHAASVVLFGLSTTLKYKQKKGRDFAGLRSELLRLISFLEGLQSATPSLDVQRCAQWRELTHQVAHAMRKAELRRAEDPVDAVLCAYIALFATRRPDDVTVYGDSATGCIITPSLTTSPSGR